MPQQLIDAEKAKKEMDAMIEMLTNPEFVASIVAMKKTPLKERKAFGEKNLTVDALKAKGVKFPPGMRMTTRYFEPGKPDVIEITPDGKFIQTKKPTYPLGGGITDNWGGCLCGGAITVCGGGGFSTK